MQQFGILQALSVLPLPCTAKDQLVVPTTYFCQQQKNVNLMQFAQFYVGDATVGGEIVV